MNALRLLPLLTLAASACASDVYVSYPAPPGSAETGTVLVRFTEDMRSVNVLVAGVLVAEDEHTERVEVTNVPAGPREVTVVASEYGRAEAVQQTERVRVDPERPAVVLVATPPRSIGYWIQSAAWAVAYGAFLIVNEHR